MKLFQTYRLDNEMLIDNGGVYEESLETAKERYANLIAVIDLSTLPSDFSVDTYTIQNGELVKASAEIITKREAAKQAIADVAEIAELRAYLTQTDYAAIKCGEIGLSMAEVYPELHTARTKARERINELQEGGAE